MKCRTFIGRYRGDMRLRADEPYVSRLAVTLGGETWCVVLHWAAVGGRAEVVGLELWSREPFGGTAGARLPDGLNDVGRPITSALLRELNIGTIVATERRDSRMFTDALIEVEETGPEESATASGMRRRLSRSMYDERHYAEVARVYQVAYAEGRSPTLAVAHHFQVSHPQAGKWISIARNQYGLLASTTKGRPSGATTRVRAGVNRLTSPVS
jgi:hypothetical protein